MRKKILFACLASLLSMEACHKIIGEGSVTTETRDTEPFSGVEADISGIVDVYPDSVRRVEVSGQENILDVLETRVTDGILHLYFQRNVRVSGKPLRVTIHMPSPNTLAVNGTADLKLIGPAEGDSLSLSVAGSGSLHTDALRLGQKLSVDLSGSGAIDIDSADTPSGDFSLSGSGRISAAQGQVDELGVSLGGSGDVRLDAVSSLKAEIHSSGSGQVAIGDTRTLEVHLSGSGNVYYTGSPEITTHISGSGKVRKR